jgi:hypothetical protein
MSRNATSTAIRRLILALITFGLVVTTIDLMLLDHHEDFRQFAPLVASFALRPSSGTSRAEAEIQALRVVMLVFLLAALLGVVFHFQGNLEFQLEINSEQSSWDLFSKVMRAKAPTALAPGVMAQLGLLGLIYTYRHPALVSSSDSGTSTGDTA